jgi:hypothetical protein
LKRVEANKGASGMDVVSTPRLHSNALGIHSAEIVGGNLQTGAGPEDKRGLKFCRYADDCNIYERISAPGKEWGRAFMSSPAKGMAHYENSPIA